MYLNCIQWFIHISFFHIISLFIVCLFLLNLCSDFTCFLTLLSPWWIYRARARARVCWFLDDSDDEDSRDYTLWSDDIVTPPLLVCLYTLLKVVRGIYSVVWVMTDLHGMSDFTGCHSRLVKFGYTLHKRQF